MTQAYRLPGSPYGYDPRNTDHNSRAIAEAVYQLAYEQRTANMIAWRAQLSGESETARGMSQAIFERMGYTRP